MLLLLLLLLSLNTENNNVIDESFVNIHPLSIPFKHKLFKDVKFNVNNLLYSKFIKYESLFVVVIILLYFQILNIQIVINHHS